MGRIGWPRGQGLGKIGTSRDKGPTCLRVGQAGAVWGWEAAFARADSRRALSMCARGPSEVTALPLTAGEEGEGTRSPGGVWGGLWWDAEQRAE